MKNVIVTGGEGFLGKFVVKYLNRLSIQTHVPSHRLWDLRFQNEVKDYLKIVTNMIGNIDAVIHLAGHVGGIGLNKAHPGTLYYDNIMMGINVLHMVNQLRIPKIVMMGTCCSYPKEPPIPFKEDDIWYGYPEPTNAPYALAKRSLLTMAQAYRQEFGTNAIYLIPANLYGPGDSFDLENSHVIPALIKKFCDARVHNRSQVTIWGDGSPTREFLYVGDCADAIVTALERYNGSAPLNIGTGESISIKDTVALIAKLTKYEGEIVYDKTKPNGQPLRMLDTNRAKAEMDWVSTISFETGLEHTINWYKEVMEYEF